MNLFEEKVFDEFVDEIKLYYCGKRFRSISHAYGPYDQDRYLIYFIKEGRATLTTKNNKTIILSKGFFVNFPQSYTSYCCDDGVPWTIKWIMAEGAILEKYFSLLGITRENPYIELNKEQNIESVFDEMYDKFDKNSLSSKIYCISLMHKLFSFLAEDLNENRSYNNYISSATKLIEENYSDPEFNVSVLAKKLGLHHNYFSILYKKVIGISPVKSITQYRIQKACKMLSFTDKLVKEVAIENGFSDELYFSRVFKNALGVSPSAFKKSRNVGI